MSPKVGEVLINTGYTNVADTLFGLECEIEAILDINSQLKAWTIHEDGSLRNNGKEFITLPCTRQLMEARFNHLHSYISVNKDEAFSSRTSIHVHVNMQNKTLKEVKRILLLYILFEEYFFSVVHPSRRGNIHCVPLTETILPNAYDKTIEHLIGKWAKYTALNLKPLLTIGTIEFRHMHGHGNSSELSDWLVLLEKLVSVGSSMEDFSPKNFSVERIGELFSNLFGHFSKHDLWKQQLPEKTFNQSLDIKLSF